MISPEAKRLIAAIWAPVLVALAVVVVAAVILF